MGRARKGWFEREEIAKVTLDYVKANCHLTKRELELLQIISDRKMVRRDMLEIISPSYRNIGSSRTRVMNRSINKMFKNMCIDKVHEKQNLFDGNKPAILALDRAGSLTLGIPHKQRIKRTKVVKNGKQYVYRILPSNYRHVNGVNQLEVDTILFCEETGSEIVRWIHESPQELHYGHEKIIIIPDVSAEIKFNTEPSKTLYAFIEFDTGSENHRYKEPPIIRDKIIKYKKYKLSQLWMDDFDEFPIILFVTEDDKRINFFNNKCKENGILGFGIYYENYKKFLMHLMGVI